MSSKNDLIEKTADELEKEISELSPEAIKDVSGAGDPFEDLPRVPDNPIDPEIRGKS